MAITTHNAYGTMVSGLTTELNSLATASNTVASAAIDNSTALDVYGDVELVLAAQGVARSAGSTIVVYMLASADGTNYPDLNEVTAEPWAVFALDAAVTARRVVMRDRSLPPGLYKLFARNNTGQALAATGNTVKIRPHSVKSV